MRCEGYSHHQSGLHNSFDDLVSREIPGGFYATWFPVHFHQSLAHSKRYTVHWKLTGFIRQLFSGDKNAASFFVHNLCLPLCIPDGFASRFRRREHLPRKVLYHRTKNASRFGGLYVTRKRSVGFGCSCWKNFNACVIREKGRVGEEVADIIREHGRGKQRVQTNFQTCKTVFESGVSASSP
jgi:hypothetical protein